MKVSELIEILQQYDSNTPVHFSYSNGDYWNTISCPEVTEVSLSNINDLQSGFVMSDDDNDCSLKAVVIS